MMIQISLSFFNFSGDETTDHNVILETPVSNNTVNRSGTDKLYKLEEQDKKRAKEEKKIYRRAIKEKEERILAQRGIKRLPKVERDSGEAIYGSYKLAKAKIKLIEALLAKPPGGGPIVFRRV